MKTGRTKRLEDVLDK
ncbi:hypothetical protein BC938DRAFT_475005 [Jimgerdemannia flammicorona]|uniref:Uncharacterized protein n=1 Tax=Jimgerdemannia flammicorona TaxID=994334 RepID=A0A433Q1F9_9FUNG|nr:hypothetical protein BC938DRAFT_475005 [Jimgerdemannia flammicorona]